MTYGQHLFLLKKPKIHAILSSCKWNSFLDNNECYGGVARLKKTVDDLKEEHDNVVFVNAGDFYQGTIWYTKFKWKVVAKFANMLNFTAMVMILKKQVTVENGFRSFNAKNLKSVESFSKFDGL